jgi:hypothetical protein
MTDDSIEAKALALPDRLRLIPDSNGLMYDEYDDVMEAADLIERLRIEAEAQYDRGYYDGCTHPIVQPDALKIARKAINGLLDIVSDYNLDSAEVGRAFAALHDIAAALKETT